MKALNFAVVLFSAIFAIVIGYRIDQPTLTILAGVTVGFIVASVAVGVLAFLVIRQNRQPARTAHQPPTGDWVYYVQHPLPKPTAHQLSAPAGPQYDETLIYTPPQANKARNWAIVDEVKR
jgi:hypothetical protein